ncbi:hypothetical protein M728_004893 (plasmid) [Ensifer sp. WSM1721]
MNIRHFLDMDRSDFPVLDIECGGLDLAVGFQRDEAVDRRRNPRDEASEPFANRTSVQRRLKLF